MDEEPLAFLRVLFQVAQGIPRRELEGAYGLENHQAVENLHEDDGGSESADYTVFNAP